jgi:predicted dehydrogenase
MYWKQAPDLTSRPADKPAVPAHIKWDVWLGPAPERPYHPVYLPHDWRGWWDFGTGALGDMACHTAAMPFMAMEPGLPARVHAVSGKVNTETYPAWATITYEFPTRDGKPPLKLMWYEGAENGKRNLPTVKFPGGAIPTPSGSLLIGSRGRLYSPGDYGNNQILDVAGKIAIPEQSLERLGSRLGTDENQKYEWIRGIQGGATPLSNFDFALTETMLLGNVAVRMGQPLNYDGKHGRVTNHAKAANFISRPRREGWAL